MLLYIISIEKSIARVLIFRRTLLFHVLQLLDMSKPDYVPFSKFYTPWKNFFIFFFFRVTYPAAAHLLYESDEKEKKYGAED